MLRNAPAALPATAGPVTPAVTAGAGAIRLAGLLIWRWRCTHKDAARARPPFRGALYPLHAVTRAAQGQGPRSSARKRPTCTSMAWALRPAGCAQSLDQLAAVIDGRVLAEVDALRYRR